MSFTNDEARRLMQKHLSSVRVNSAAYPRPLSPELAKWYSYTADGGHCIYAAIKSHYRPGEDPKFFMVPVPVRAVERVGYTITTEGYVLVDVMYRTDIGLVVHADDDEY